MLENLMDNLLVLVIALLGFSYMSIGRARKRTVRIEKENGKSIYIRKNNFTKNLILVIVVILIIESLFKSI